MQLATVTRTNPSGLMQVAFEGKQVRDTACLVWSQMQTVKDKYWNVYFFFLLKKKRLSRMCILWEMEIGTPFVCKQDAFETCVYKNDQTEWLIFANIH